jgi:ribonuclease E
MSDTIKRELIVNYVPNEECRIAAVVEGKLEEFYSERSDNISHVGNIYVGKVTNVEPAIQAAFVDFGLGTNGFLHQSDLHPRYFPGEDGETTERVGKKTPRRDRPPIQECLHRGQEIIVQVLKEGVGTKGPSLTSYLSIPGRYLVMMPGMDRVGVSRKVEDEDLRRKMVAILDQLELPDGFGFIVRTAGLDRSKTELKRDLAYLMRLQKDMERRRASSNKPRLLYSESDLLLRVMRDVVTTETDRVVIDSEIAMKRAARFMKIVSPRTATKLVHYTGRTPIFHAMGIESQVRTMYQREVPLPSGGRLVIDEAEALVAIDVNSGKHRDASDSETNALKTNLEAAEEICRQLRLRDMGGIVVNDLIDMRSAKHRREVEERFNELLKNDRARSTVTPISEFGVLEMTRQRMRASHESIHFHSCPHCHGRGLIQRPDSVASDALREASALLDHDKVARIEMVVHPRIAGELLSGKRKLLVRIERMFAKAITVRLSDATATDRVTFYAYDAQGNDIEIDRLPRFKASNDTLKPIEDPEIASGGGEDEEQFDFSEPDEPEVDAAEQADPDLGIPGADLPDEGPNLILETSGRGGKRRRRGRGGKDRRDDRGPRHGHNNNQGPRPPQQAGAPVDGAAPVDGGAPVEGQMNAAPAGDGNENAADGATHDTADGGDQGQGPVVLGPDGQPMAGDGEGGRRKRRRRGRRGRGGGGGGQGGQPGGHPGQHQRGPAPGGHHQGPRPSAPAGDGPPSSLAEMFRAAAGDGTPSEQGHEPGNVNTGDDHDQHDDGPDDGHDDAPTGEHHQQGQHPQGQQGGDGEGGRRKRRRRGRRGRGGGGGGGGQPGGNPQGGQQRQGGGGNFNNNNGGGGGNGGGQPRPAPMPAPALAAASAPAPKPAVPRLFATNRRLKPGQLGSIKRED